MRLHGVMGETVTMTLTEFLLARTAEDEEAAVAARDFRWEMPEDSPWVYAEQLARFGSVTQALIARHDPARVLAECAAKRRIVEEHRPDREGVRCGCCWLDDLETWEPHPCPTMRATAAVYADHPDYRAEWAL